MFSRNLLHVGNSSRVITYINIRLSLLCFSLWKDIFNHRDISCVSFFNHGLVHLLINIYSDSSQSALKYLKDTEVNISNISSVLIMTGDFNIKNSIWDPDFPHHSLHSNILFEVVDSLHLELSKPTKYFPIRYSNNQWDCNSVIDLIFLRPESIEHDNHSIHPDWRLTSDHAPLTINISIFEEHIQTRKWTLAKNSKEEEYFLNKLINAIKKINIKNIQSKEVLKSVIQLFIYHMNRTWYKHLKITNITKYLKEWWDENYWRDLDNYKQTKKIGNTSRVWLRRQNTISSIWKFKKYQTKSAGLENSWIGSKSTNSQQSKPSSITVICVSN